MNLITPQSRAYPQLQKPFDNEYFSQSGGPYSASTHYSPTQHQELTNAQQNINNHQPYFNQQLPFSPPKPSTQDLNTPEASRLPIPPSSVSNSTLPSLNTNSTSTSTLPGSPMISQPPIDELGESLIPAKKQIKISEDSPVVKEKITALKAKSETDDKKIKNVLKILTQIKAKYPTVTWITIIKSWFNNTIKSELKILKLEKTGAIKDTTEVLKFCDTVGHDRLIAKYTPKLPNDNNIKNSSVRPLTDNISTPNVMQAPPIVGPHMLRETQKSISASQGTSTDVLPRQ